MAGERSERDFWEQRAAAWERRIDAVGRFTDGYGRAAMDALAVGPGDRVVDVGCGPGTTAVELAARVGPTGEVIALDIAPGMVEAARRRADGAGATNVRAVVHDLEEGPVDEGLDAAFSRFGVMFFPDPPRALANLAASLRPGGRFAASVWGALGDNPWMFVPTLATAGLLGVELAIPGPGEPGPFSLSDPADARSLLEGAGFSDVAVEAIPGARLVSAPDAAAEVAALLEVGPVGEAYGRADAETRRRATDAVLEAIEPFRDGAGWRLSSSALLLTAVSA